MMRRIRKRGNEEMRKWRSDMTMGCVHEWGVARCEDSLDLDVFLMQLCAVLTPPDEFVSRVLQRFSLVDYFVVGRRHQKE